MFRSLLSLVRTTERKARGQAVPKLPRRRQSPSALRIEELESRLVPSSVPLHVSGTQLADPSGNTVVLRGVNITGLESFPTGLTGDAAQVLRTADVALDDWHANLIRLMVYPDYWFGHDAGAGLGEVDPTPYRNLIDQIVAKASDHGAYVMLAVWGSDMGDPGLQPALRDLPDNGTRTFWQNAAPRYANNPTVLFDPFNEPHDDGSGQVGWAQWRNGGSVTETSQEGETRTYSSPGMQALLTAIRAAGANNVVAAEGLGYSSDLSGVAAGFGLSDSAHNLMYQLHLYPAEWQSAADGDARAQPVVAGNTRYPLYVGEFGTPYGADDPAAGVNGVPQQGAGPWTQDMLSWLDQHRYSWSAWSLNPDSPPSLISDWDYTPTDYFGTIVQDNLTNHAAIASYTATALSSLQMAMQLARIESSYAAATHSAGAGFAVGSYVDSYLAYSYAQRAANTQSAADWARAEQYAWMAQENAMNDYAVSGNPFALDACNFDLYGYMFAEVVGTPETA